MLARFYLSGPFSASTLSDNFTIVGNPGNYITTGVTKTEMQYPSYKEIVFLDSVTGGTVTAVGGTCNGTSVNWAVIQGTPTPTPTKPTPTCYTYLIENSYISPQPFTYSPCSTGTITEVNINGYSSLTICSSILPTSTSKFVVITNIGL